VAPGLKSVIERKSVQQKERVLERKRAEQFKRDWEQDSTKKINDAHETEWQDKHPALSERLSYMPPIPPPPPPAGAGAGAPGGGGKLAVGAVQVIVE